MNSDLNYSLAATRPASPTLQLTVPPGLTALTLHNFALDMKQLPLQLQSLELRGLEISDIAPLTALQHLTSLRLCDIPAFTCILDASCPLLQLTSLQHLYLKTDPTASTFYLMQVVAWTYMSQNLY